MRVVFLKDTKDYKAGYEGFIPRMLGRVLCQQDITIPWSEKDNHPAYKALKKPKRKPQKKAVSKKFETREKAIKQ